MCISEYTCVGSCYEVTEEKGISCGYVVWVQQLFVVYGICVLGCVEFVVCSYVRVPGFPV